MGLGASLVCMERLLPSDVIPEAWLQFAQTGQCAFPALTSFELRIGDLAPNLQDRPVLATSLANFKGFSTINAKTESSILDVKSETTESESDAKIESSMANQDRLLSYELAGMGRPIIFVHGLTYDRRIWRPIVDLLSADFTCIAVDLPGHGESLDLTSYDLDSVAICVKVLADELYLVGPSWKRKHLSHQFCLPTGTSLREDALEVKAGSGPGDR
jgi:hypothetical protein